MSAPAACALLAAAAVLALSPACGTEQEALLGPAADAVAAAELALERTEAETSDEPDVVLLAARAHLHLALLDSDHEEPARALLARLETLAVADGVAGWGLTWAWDAFQDGSRNPADTIYTYTTAAAGLAYVDAYEVLGDDRYLDLAGRAVRVILEGACCWDDGRRASVWYSDQAADARAGYQVHNVSALTLAVLERLAGHGVDLDPGLRDRLARHLVDAQGSGWERPRRASPANWPYARGFPVANDLLHETFIVEGLRGRRDGEQAAGRALEGILAVHFDEEGTPGRGRHTLGSNEWGPPAALYVLAGQPRLAERTDRIAARLAASIRADGTSRLAPEGSPRALGWYALALARWAAGEAGAELP